MVNVDAQLMEQVDSRRSDDHIDTAEKVGESNFDVDPDLIELEADQEDTNFTSTANITTVDLKQKRMEKLKQKGLFIISEGDESNSDPTISKRSSFVEE